MKKLRSYNDKHHWSGWPGAICFKCGAEDPMEIALADGWFDPYTGEWDSKEHEDIVSKLNKCPVIGTLVWDNKENIWKLVK